jgi:phage shock protein PspC (stress-responsive transcriptional regulator)/nitrate reductase NapAB chaperone NapD
MNKTVTINISSIIFHIEEDAFEKLSKYLSTIKGYFSNTESGNEIMSDIEARIAEMLQNKISSTKQVVLMSDVDFVMESMGKPEEFAGDASDNNSGSQVNQNESDENTEVIKKRLYRDGDNKIFGGVCSGIGHYFGIDSVWLRIALLLMLFFAGTGILLYIILWIAMPEAKTIAEKLAMKGEKADINNISKAVKEEAEQLKKRMEKYGNEFKNMANNNRDVPRNAAEKLGHFIIDIFFYLVRVSLKIVAALFMVAGVILFIGLFTSVFGLSFLTNNTTAKEWIDLLLLDGKDFHIGLIGIVFFIGTPIIMMIYICMKFLFKLKYTNRWVNRVAGVIWLVGFVVLLYVAINTGKDFNKTAKVRENTIVVPFDTLYLKMNEMPIDFEEINASDDDQEGEKGFEAYKKSNDYLIGTNNGIKYLLGHAQLNIIKSQTDKIIIVVVKEAKGSDKRNATDRAKKITYKVSQTDSLIEFDNLFKVNNADKFRFQDIKVILKLPVGKIVYLDKSLESLIYDIENMTNTYDGDMINRKWMMTENGFKCIDCDSLVDYSNSKNELDSESNNSENVSITANGVDVKTKDAQIKIDDNGVKINSKASKLTIDQKGIQLDSKKNQ